MRPHRMIRYMLVALLVALAPMIPGARDTAGETSAEVTATTPRMVAVSPLGTINRRQVFEILVNQLSGRAVAFGYFMYITGLDDDALYANDSRKHESVAFFNLYIEGKITRTHKLGRLLIFQLQSKSVISYDPNPDGDFSNPATFKNGIPIATGDENGSFTYDPQTGDGIGDVRLTQTAAFPFEFNGEQIQFGEVGNHMVEWRGKTQFYNPLGWTRLYCTATTIQGAPVPADQGPLQDLPSP